jgi:hypothetical protein
MKKITPKLLLRIAAIILLLHTLGHTIGFANWQKPNGTVPAEVINIMTDTHFSVQGKDTTMANSFSGFGYTVSIFLLSIICILWIISKSSEQSFPILFSVGFGILLLALDEFVFFFPAVAILSLTASLTVFTAAYKIKRNKTM